MNTAKTLIAAALLTLITASAAYAKPKIMATAPAEHQYPTAHTMFCDIVNLNSTAKNITVEIMDYNGNPTTGPFGPFLLLPNRSFALPEFTGFGAWCRWTVEGSTKKFRATAVYDNGTEYTVSIPGY